MLIDVTSQWPSSVGVKHQPATIVFPRMQPLTGGYLECVMDLNPYTKVPFGCNPDHSPLMKSESLRRGTLTRV